MDIGFIGTGSMGKPMAENLIAQGHDLFVFDRTREKTESLNEQGGTVLDTPGEVAAGRGIVVSMVSNDSARKEVVFGTDVGSIASADGLLEPLPNDGIHLSMSTISPELARKLDEVHAKRGHSFVSAPIFGKPNLPVTPT